MLKNRNVMEQSDLLGLWRCLRVMLHAKKCCRRCMKGGEKDVGEKGAGSEASLLQLKFDDTKRIWKIQTVAATRGSVCAHTHARMCKTLTLTCLIRKSTLVLADVVFHNYSVPPLLPSAARRHHFPATCLRLCPAHFEFVDFGGLAQFRADVFITEAPKLVDESHLVRCR